MGEQADTVLQPGAGQMMVPTTRRSHNKMCRAILARVREQMRAALAVGRTGISQPYFSQIVGLSGAPHVAELMEQEGLEYVWHGGESFVVYSGDVPPEVMGRGDSVAESEITALPEP